MDPVTIALIAGGVGKLFGAIGGKKRANAQENQDELAYNDSVTQWLAAQKAAEEDRQRKISLVSAYARGNNMDAFLTPEIMATISKPKTIVAPPPFRRGGTPGFGWDLAGVAAETAGSIYASNKAGKLSSAEIAKRARLGKPGMSPAWTIPPSPLGGAKPMFGGAATWDPYSFQ